MTVEGAGGLLHGSVSVVAGGSSGIGRAVVERFVEHDLPSSSRPTTLSV